MWIAMVLILLLVLAVYAFIQQPPFGAVPSGERRARIRSSVHYVDKAFQNLHPTAVMAEDVNAFKVLKDFFFDKSDRLEPAQPLPSVKTDLNSLPPGENVLVWFGHSSYYLQVEGKKILVDPVFSRTASPFSFITKSYAGTNVYVPEDMPEIDYLIITHDHWDHLDYRTMMRLQGKTGKIITGLGTGAHLERWGFAKESIHENDWHDEISLEDGFSLVALPARHFSGRSVQRSQSLWLSFALTTPTRKLYLGGDSGYDTHFAEIGNTYGPFDLAILECGQYHRNWPQIHMMPEETVQASLDLRARHLLPVHWGKFSLSQHAWDEPIIRAREAAREKAVALLHPRIGEKLDLDHPLPGSCWWEEVKG